jgi:hypothetical protein
MPTSKVKSIPSKYKVLGKERHIVVESGYSMRNGRKVPAYRIVGRLWGR